MLSQEVDLTPALLAPTSEMRAARVTGLTQTVAEIETLISHLSPNSDKSISQLKLLRARIIFSLSPISAVVEEILLRIFDWVIHMKQAQSHSMWRWSLDLSHTCSQWRSITIGRSRLWSRLTVSYPKQNPLISLFCVRSRLVRCNLRISSYPPGGPIQIPRSSIEIQPSSAPQISEITFRDRGAFDALRLDDLAMSLLSLNHVCAIDVLFTQSNFPSYILRVPSLELVSCSFDAELLSEITFNLLHHLTLGAQMDGKGALLLVAAHMPVLDHLIINGVSVDDEIAVPTKTFISLRRLELKDTQSDFHQLVGSALLFPNLDYLSIQKLFVYHNWELSDQKFPNMVKRCASIKTLHLHVLNADDLVRMLTGLESLDTTPSLCQLKLTLGPLRPSSYGFDSDKELQAPSKLRELLTARVMGTMSVPPLRSLTMSRRAAGEHAFWYAAEAEQFEFVDDSIFIVGGLA